LRVEPSGFLKDKILEEKSLNGSPAREGVERENFVSDLVEVNAKVGEKANTEVESSQEEESEEEESEDEDEEEEEESEEEVSEDVVVPKVENKNQVSVPLEKSRVDLVVPELADKVESSEEESEEEEETEEEEESGEEEETEEEEESEEEASGDEKTKDLAEKANANIEQIKQILEQSEVNDRKVAAVKIEEVPTIIIA
jgi:hypothetical protein